MSRTLEELRSLPRRRSSVAGRRVRWPVVAGGLLLSLAAAAGTAAVAIHPDAAPPLRAVEDEPTVTTAPPAPPARTAPAVAYADGIVQTADGKWDVGQPGDVPAVGDWDCDGTPTLALLRPATGEVFAFVEWATVDHDLTGDRLGVVEAGATLAVTDVDGDGCDDLVVRTADGRSTTLHPPDHL